MTCSARDMGFVAVKRYVVVENVIWLGRPGSNLLHASEDQIKLWALK